NSVLEHVPKDDVTPVLENVFSDLSPGGIMVHCIHLEDHKEHFRVPFAFLEIPASDYSRSLQTIRGNRIRASDWKRRFETVGDSTSRFLYSWSRPDVGLPSWIDPSIDHQGEADMRVSHVGVLTQKR